MEETMEEEDEGLIPFGILGGIKTKVFYSF
jgi:hypothetical protein